MPIILAEISPGKYNVIDGNHRIEKAYRLGTERIPAYILTARQHLRFLTTVKAYHAYAYILELTGHPFWKITDTKTYP